MEQSKRLQTDKRIDLDEAAKTILDEKLRIVQGSKVDRRR